MLHVYNFIFICSQRNTKAIQISINIYFTLQTITNCRWRVNTPIFEGTLCKNLETPPFQLTPHPKAPYNYAVTQRPHVFWASDQKLQICYTKTSYSTLYNGIFDQKWLFFKDYFSQIFIQICEKINSFFEILSPKDPLFCVKSILTQNLSFLIFKYCLPNAPYIKNRNLTPASVLYGSAPSC